MTICAQTWRSHPEWDALSFGMAGKMMHNPQNIAGLEIQHALQVMCLMAKSGLMRMNILLMQNTVTSSKP